ncbi:late nodulin [Medicago truncatula]|uniref:Late nodulin n=1 Tax=Medicago truncatula TaxID=3880 RepID=G7IZC6_MEDTR|nr:late nodulin [Medicago truncatula]
MAETFKFVYIVILLVSLCLVVVDGECENASDCYSIYWRAPYGTMRCVKGHCKQIKDVKVMKFLYCV